MTSDAQPDLSVAVVSYNTRDLLRACLASLPARQAEGEAALEIIVADNGSTDGSVEMVARRVPRRSRWSRPAATSASGGPTTSLWETRGAAISAC